MTDLWDEIVGAWTLAGITEFADDGTERKPYGDRPNGQLVYSEDGHMAVVIGGHGPAPAVAYAGTVTVADGRVRHVVAVGLPPFTADQERFARLEDRGAKLVLATEQPGSPRIELHWARLGAITA